MTCGWRGNSQRNKRFHAICPQGGPACGIVSIGSRSKAAPAKSVSRRSFGLIEVAVGVVRSISQTKIVEHTFTSSVHGRLGVGAVDDQLARHVPAKRTDKVALAPSAVTFSVASESAAGFASLERSLLVEDAVFLRVTAYNLGLLTSGRRGNKPSGSSGPQLRRWDCVCVRNKQMLTAESHRNLERVRQIGRQGEELGPLRGQGFLESPVSSGFVGGTLGSLAPTTFFSELPAEPESWFVGAVHGDIARRVMHQDVASASREMESRPMRDLEVGGYFESRGDEVRRRLPGKPPRSPLIHLYERRLSELRERLRSLESARITNAAATNRALLGAMVDESWLGARLLTRLAEQRTASDLATLVGESVDAVAVALARLHRGGAVDAESGRFLRTERGTEMVTRLQQTTGVDLAAA